MTRAPVCPVCGSTAVSTDPSNGGAGRNVCHCGHRAPVRDFYDPKVAADITATGQRILREALENARYYKSDFSRNDMIEAYLQQPVMIEIPDGFKWDDKTGTIVPVRTIADDPEPTHPPAPIRQYKDD